METEKLNITLPADVARMIRGQVESGAYTSNSEVVRDALRLWQQSKQEREQHLNRVRASLNEAADNPERFTHEELSRHFAIRLNEAEKNRDS